MKTRVFNGVDRIEDYAHLFHGKRIALLSNASSINKQGEPTCDLLAKYGRLELLLAPEHGLRGNLQAGNWGKETRDPETGAKMISVNASDPSGLCEELRHVDLLVYDIQDVGARFYTYLYNLTDAMHTCRESGCACVVLDRINLIGGETVEGEILDEVRFSSGVGKYAIPTRYGLTIGELARYLNTEKGIGCELTVVPCEGWNRALYGDETDLLFVNPSPNIATVHSAINYIGNCIWEATNVSEGRGTTRPFDVIGAPFIDSCALYDEMRTLNLPGVVFRRAFFTPTFHKHKGEVCQGLEMHITDRSLYSPTLCMLHLFAHMQRYAEFQVREEQLAHLFGTDLLSRGFDIPSFLEQNQISIQKFKQSTSNYLLYE